MSELPEPLQDIIEDFQMLEGQEKLEYLIELSEGLPPLPERLAARRDEMDVVHECMTTVFLHAEKDEDGRLEFFIDVPPEAPTVRGFANLLMQGLNGVKIEQLLKIPTEFYLRMGLQQVLSSQRLNGVGAILEHMKRTALDA